MNRDRNNFFGKLLDKDHLKHALNFKMSGLFDGAVHECIFDHRRNAPGRGYAAPATRKLHLSREHLKYYGKRDQWWSDAFGDVEIFEFFVLELEGAELIGEGIVVDRDGNVLLESTIFREKYLQQLRQNHLIYFRGLLPAGSQAGTVISLANVLKWNYYHWIMEGIGRLVLLQLGGYLKGDESLFVGRNPPAYIGDSINFLFPRYCDRLLVTPPVRSKPRILVLPSFPYTNNTATRGNDVYLPDVITGINAMALYRMQGKQRKPVNLLISRARTNQRRLLNDDFLIQELAELKLQRVFLEDLKFAEQVELFYNANIIIAPHGAGLTNILFCDKGTTVIELFPDNRDLGEAIGPVSISIHLGLTHFFIECETTDEKRQDILVGESTLEQIKQAVHSTK